ncbi:MAG: lysine--tRNA ligase [Proteobacteria bacterium]|nr:lysine--tRNA ligase [Pseudomonadota bacterium]
MTELDSNEQIAQRKAKLAALREQGNAYPNDFRRDALASQLLESYASEKEEDLVKKSVRVKVAGRIMTRRLMGKASFVHLQDMSGRIQLYIARDLLPEGVYDTFKTWDLGDIIGAEGQIFRTQTGELSIKVDHLQLLSKSLRPLPDKFHGLTDHEQRFRQRYLDLLVNEPSRRIFQMRSQIISELRKFLESHGFIEVETPMMQPQAGGATARPFRTHHNAMDMELYLRIAPELYLKRLVVGGFEKVFEINRNFRNEGISTRHNPEFTMVEFYQAFQDYKGLMDFTEQLLRYLAERVHSALQLTYQGMVVDLSKPFKRMTLKSAILHYCPEIKPDQLEDVHKARDLARQHDLGVPDSAGLGKLQSVFFESFVEEKLVEPTFITEYPAEVSPLARANDKNPFITDRFELYIAGRELANGFSELNDPEDQANRFQQQVQARAEGDDEAMTYDADYITALEYGLAPTAGEGIGIDRLVMLFTDSPSIRDVILFPLLRFKD